jgi:hypothetical protein
VTVPVSLSKRVFMAESKTPGFPGVLLKRETRLELATLSLGS